MTDFLKKFFAVILTVFMVIGLIMPNFHYARAESTEPETTNVPTENTVGGVVDEVTLTSTDSKVTGTGSSDKPADVSKGESENPGISASAENKDQEKNASDLKQDGGNTSFIPKKLLGIEPSTRAEVDIKPIKIEEFTIAVKEYENDGSGFNKVRSTQEFVGMDELTDKDLQLSCDYEYQIAVTAKYSDVENHKLGLKYEFGPQFKIYTFINSNTQDNRFKLIDKKAKQAIKYGDNEEYIAYAKNGETIGTKNSTFVYKVNTQADPANKDLAINKGFSDESFKFRLDPAFVDSSSNQVLKMANDDQSSKNIFKISLVEIEENTNTPSSPEEGQTGETPEQDSTEKTFKEIEGAKVCPTVYAVDEIKYSLGEAVSGELMLSKGELSKRVKAKATSSSGSLSPIEKEGNDITVTMVYPDSLACENVKLSYDVNGRNEEYQNSENENKPSKGCDSIHKEGNLNVCTLTWENIKPGLNGAYYFEPEMKIVDQNPKNGSKYEIKFKNFEKKVYGSKENKVSIRSSDKEAKLTLVYINGDKYVLEPLRLINIEEYSMNWPGTVKQDNPEFNEDYNVRLGTVFLRNISPYSTEKNIL